MNYLWGAVNAISAPYQYYKELPPINPATLTGAIDVIVVRRPAQDGGTELACSPFHVRFGKWQVLRPGEKKVNVSVNGKPIPFHMKIGEAGEAFFVFETEGDVPDELITSPLLEATKPGESSPQVDAAGRLGARDSDRAREGSQEPDFLDLDASSSLPTSSALHPPSPRPPQGDGERAQVAEAPSADRSGSQPTPSGLSLFKRPAIPSSVLPPSNGHAIDDGGRFGVREGAERASEALEKEDAPLSILARPAGFGKAIMNAVVEAEKDMAARFEDRAVAAYNMANAVVGERAEPTDAQLRLLEQRGDEALGEVRSDDVQMPEIIDNGDVVIDMGGYHSQRRHPSGSETGDGEPSSDASVQPSTPSTGTSAPRAIPFPSFPASASPPSTSPTRPPTLSAPPLEYSWEWGAFPQKSPMRAQYPRTITKAPVGIEELAGEDAAPEPATPADLHRSKSLPPEFDVDDEAGPSLSRPATPQMDRNDGALSDGDLEEEEEEGVEEGEEQRLVERRGSAAGMAGDTQRTSWVRWWRRSSGRTQSADLRSRDGQRERKVSATGDRPLLKGANTAPAPTALQRAATHAIPVPDAGVRAPSNRSAPASLPDEAPIHDFVSAPPSAPPQDRRKRYAKTLRLNSEQLHSLDLHPGANTITFSLSASGVAACTARVFVWEHTDLIVVSDIDGTITKSDALGHVFTMIGRDWTHLGVAKLYTDICRNGYKIMYLTSRAIGQADSTRYYLQGIKQNDYQLPEGPVIMSPDRLMASLHREVIMRKPEVFKMACLRDIQRLYGNVSSGPFYAGFGNRITDALSYRSVNIPSSRIFTIDSNGEVKMELLELAGYNSPSVASYIHMTDLVDQMFPPIQHKWESAFTDNIYWKTPVQDFPLPELTPPSPALSARSDTSNQSTLARLRNFSLRSTSGSIRTFTLPPPATNDERRGRAMGDTHIRVRQLSSIERLGGALAGFALSPSRSVSPEASSTRYSGEEDEEEEVDDGAGGVRKPRRRRRNRSRTSMPGSLPGSRASFSSESDLEFGASGALDGAEGEEGETEEVAEQAFDEDLFATGEMQSVPFL